MKPSCDDRIAYLLQPVYALFTISGFVFALFYMITHFTDKLKDNYAENYGFVENEDREAEQQEEQEEEEVEESTSSTHESLNTHEDAQQQKEEESSTSQHNPQTLKQRVDRSRNLVDDY